MTAARLHSQSLMVGEYEESNERLYLILNKILVLSTISIKACLGSYGHTGVPVHATDGIHG